jgi:hypothetical protein
MRHFLVGLYQNLQNIALGLELGPSGRGMKEVKGFYLVSI